MDSEFGKPLREFAKDKSQPELAEMLGVTQSAVSQMLNSSRDIRVRCEAGECSAVEIRPIGRKRKPKN
ncbi:Cro/CI family transcriptional regulator [Pseudomonas guariconensis]|uniref:Cro/CI family transcriptional regulator n=1 Tax=Pseudomonas guariconensis TaxID=1288410 RepID=UPI0018AC000F|nr:helix-turn-helix domain-containing protein [Pseudomonas guariconensis]